MKMASSSCREEDNSGFEESYRDFQERAYRCKVNARKEVSTAKQLAEEAEVWVANNIASDDSERKESLKELSDKYDRLRSAKGPGESEQPGSSPEGSHFIEEYEELTAHVLQLMRKAEDEANGLTDDYGKYGAEGCLPECGEKFGALILNAFRARSKGDARKNAVKYSDLLEVIQREKRSLYKVNVHLQSCLDLVSKLIDGNAIGKLRMDKLAFTANNLRISCDAFLNR